MAKKAKASDRAIARAGGKFDQTKALVREIDVPLAKVLSIVF